MNAGKVDINDIFKRGRRLEVPFYQRAYIWEEEQWERLLEDLAYITATQRNYFIGSIILKEAKTYIWEVAASKRIIVDGQQRLTTLLLFFRVLSLRTGTIADFDSTFRLSDKSMALCLGMNDDEAFTCAMQHEKTEEIVGVKTTSNIIAAFNYFLRNVDPARYDYNIISRNLQFVCIELDEGEDEQQVFDTINSLGVRLTTAELLKNYFYSREDVDLYKKNWVEVFEKDDDIRTYWNREFETGRITRTMIDVFFDSYFQLFFQNSRYKVSAEDKIVYDRLDRLALSYQDFIKTYCGGDKQVILAPMAAYANKFREVFDPTCVDRHMAKDSGLERINVIIFGLKTTTLIPYILYLMMNTEDKADLEKMLAILEAFVMRRIVVKSSAKNYNNLFSSLILNKVHTSEDLLLALKRYQDSTMSVPSDEVLKRGFESSRLNNLQAKGVIYFIESGIRSAKNALELLGFSKYSLEHLMPRKWRNHWDRLDNPELERIRDLKLATLGNFAIITQALNTAISDSEWKTKKQGKKDNPGLDLYAAGLQTMEGVLSEEIWDESKIDKRAEWLFEKARELWAAVLPAVTETDEQPLGTQGEQSGQIRKQYWEYALPMIQAANAHRGIFNSVFPSIHHELSGYFGLSGFRIACGVTNDYSSVFLYMGNQDADENKKTFDYLFQNKEMIESQLGTTLSWSRADEYKASWVSLRLDDVCVMNQGDWPKMAQFHAEWSGKLSEVLIPYLLKEDASTRRLIEIASTMREWAGKREEVNLSLLKSNRTYTRFTTDYMSEVFPEIPDVPSGWGTDNRYFYEIINRTGNGFYIQLVLSSKNATEEFLETCEKVNRFYPAMSKNPNWQWRMVFRTKTLNIEENYTKEDLFAKLDASMKEILQFEGDLRKLMENPDIPLDSLIKTTRTKETDEPNEGKLKRAEFWTRLNDMVDQRGNPFSKRKASTDHWYQIAVGSSQCYIQIDLVNKEHRIRVGMWIPDNKVLFDHFLENKEEIEQNAGCSYIWNRLDDKKASAIYTYIPDLDFDKQDNYPDLMNKIIDTAITMRSAFKPFID